MFMPGQRRLYHGYRGMPEQAGMAQEYIGLSMRIFLAKDLIETVKRPLADVKGFRCQVSGWTSDNLMQGGPPCPPHADHQEIPNAVGTEADPTDPHPDT